MREFMIAGLAFALVSVAPASAETRDAAGFESISASGRFQVEIAVGDDHTVSVQGSDAARIRTRVEDHVLKIEPLRRPWFGNPRYDAVVRVTLPRLEGVSAARGASVAANVDGACEDFSAAAAMGSQLRVSGLACASVNAAAAMGAELRLQGTCDTLEVAAAMGADVNARELRCRTVDAAAAMGGGIAAYASETFDASAAMGGDVDMSGGGRAVGRSEAMGGDVRASAP